MEHTLDSDIIAPKPKIYRHNAITVGTYIGGPLVASYFMAENFKAYNERDKANTTWVVGIIATIVVFGIAFIIPDPIRIPNHLIPLFYTLITHMLVQHYQGSYLREHKISDGQFYGWGRSILVSIIGMAVTSLPIMGIAFAIEFFPFS